MIPERRTLPALVFATAALCLLTGCLGGEPDRPTKLEVHHL